MLTVRKFVDSAIQPPIIQMCKPEVPLFWKGYYAIYKPNGKDKFWVKRWHQNNNGKIFNTAYMSIDISQAHDKWNEFLNTFKN